MICSGVCRLLPIVDLPVAATKMPDPNIRTGLVSGGHVRGGLDIVSLVFSQSESPGEPIARIRFENGGRWRFVGKGNEDMASYVAESIIRLIRPDSLDRQPTDY